MEELKKTRAEKRKKLDDFKACSELIKIIRHFFPDLLPMLKRVKDPRNQSYITYERQVILMVRILAAIFHIGSMRKTTEEFNKDECIRNVSVLLGIEELEELPHWSTINNYLEKIKDTELENVIQKLVYRLIRMRYFENSRIRDKYWQILIDGTGIYNSNERHCPHCLTKKHKDKDGNVKWIEYYHNALEAKLVLNGVIVISIATQFIENEKPDVSKQDCELNAFYRLAEKLKKAFPRLPICLCMDSLYAAGPVFELCKHCNWHFIIRFKDGSLPTVAKDFHALKTMESSQIFSIIENGVTKTYRYVTDIDCQSHKLNVVECVQSDREYPFVFLTDLPVSKRNYAQLVEDGRRRWKIENQGFNVQKNHGYELEHLFSHDYNAMKNHYLLIQIGHMIAQIFQYAFTIWNDNHTPDYMIFQILKLSFLTVLLSAEDISTIASRKQYRFH